MFWPWLVSVLFPAQRWGRAVNVVLNGLLYLGVTGAEAWLANFALEDWLWLRFVAILGIALLGISSWRQFGELHPAFGVDFDEPWVEWLTGQTDSIRVHWVVRITTTVRGADGELGAEIIDIKATQDANRPLPLEWADRVGEWIAIPSGQERTINLGEAVVDKKGGLQHFSVRGPKLSHDHSSLGADRKRPLPDADRRIYCKVRVTDTSGHSDVSREIELGGADGEGFVRYSGGD